MKIAINQKPQNGPWGGGNRFVSSLVTALKASGHTVQFHLEKGVDIVLMVETRLRSPNVTFDAGSILRHLALYDKNTVVIHRINECDERKGEKFITHRLLRANYAADLTVFVGSWLMELPAWKSYDRAKAKVILNGADTSVFHAQGHEKWHGGRVKIVTHHWSWHPYKGFDVYRAIDERLDDTDFSSRYEMTYVGNVPPGKPFRNIRHVPPLNGVGLADELRQHHVYLTASIGEPGGNHQNEGALCGLPLLYRNSGCLPEYCDGFGQRFEGVDDVFLALDQLAARLQEAEARMPEYPHTSEKMVAEWMAFLDEALGRRERIAQERKIFRSPVKFLRNQVPL